MRILALQGPLKFIFDAMNVLPAGITSVDVPTALHALLHALKNGYNSTCTR
jgi:NAD(P)H-hydrate repair Nnr-like enzyme with NAD(P)H-hydrate epimerase domain